MKRKSPITRYMILTSLLIIAQASSIQGMSYDRPTLPSCNTAVDAGTRCARGLIERRSVVNLAILNFPASSFRQDYLQYLKDMCALSLDRYLNMVMTTNGPNDLVYWDSESILNHVPLDEDYFADTPHLNLEAWDATNRFGWHGITLLLTNLIYTYEYRTVVASNTTEENLFIAQIPEGAFTNYPYTAELRAALCAAPLCTSTVSTSQDDYESDTRSFSYLVGGGWRTQAFIGSTNSPDYTYAQKREVYQGEKGWIGARLCPTNSPLAGRSHQAEIWQQIYYNPDYWENGGEGPPPEMSDDIAECYGYDPQNRRWIKIGTALTSRSWYSDSWVHFMDFGPMAVGCDICSELGFAVGQSADYLYCDYDPEFIWWLSMGGSLNVDIGFQTAAIINWDFVFK
jgi:hypothetical protein